MPRTVHIFLYFFKFYFIPFFFLRVETGFRVLGDRPDEIVLNKLCGQRVHAAYLK